MTPSNSPTQGSQTRAMLRDLFMALRPTQWSKNLVVLAAFFFALGDTHQTLNIWPSAEKAVAATLLFCLVSSSVYILNDIRDRNADRNHPVKRYRPIAGGRVSIPRAVTLALVTLAAGLAGAMALSPPFTVVVTLYAAIQVVYCFILKQVALVDIFIIAIGFVLRAVGGAVVLSVEISPWLLLCTFLLALFLALCKRRQEKVATPDSDEEKVRRSLTSYDERLLDLLIAITASSTLVCYAIYTLAPATVDKFGTSYLSATVPFVAFGIFRYMDLVYRHDKGDRPEKILLSDVPIIVNLLLYGGCVLAIFLARRIH